MGVEVVVLPMNSEAVNESGAPEQDAQAWPI